MNWERDWEETGSDLLSSSYWVRDESLMFRMLYGAAGEQEDKNEDEALKKVKKNIKCIEKH